MSAAAGKFNPAETGGGAKGHRSRKFLNF